MGAAREATWSSLAEPALFFGFLALARMSDSYSLSTMLGPVVAADWSTAGATLGAILVSWCVVLLAENSRIPFDDPNTHLELTMIHEVMVLDHSGPPFGIILYSAAMKLFVFASLVLDLAAPLGGVDPWLSWVLFVAGILVLAVAVGAIESLMARLRLTQVPTLLIAACLMSAFGAVLLVR
jgi:formate hydrogenlyase subunit 4